VDSKVVLSEGRKQLELFLEKQFSEGNFDRLVTQLKNDLEAVIPGTFGDAAIEAIFPVIIPSIKSFLLAQIEKISDEV
jgi:hypothetical protein